MATQVKLAASVRTGLGRQAVKKIKASGQIPAVIYGAEYGTQSLQIPAVEMKSALSHALGEQFLVDLEISGEGAKASTLALVQEVQHHPVTREILHIDFHAVQANETVEAEIPVEPKGEAIGVKSGGGTLEQSTHALQVECLPRDLPDFITVDVSQLNIGDLITVADLKLPNGVTALQEPEVVVFLVSAPRVAEEEAVDETPAVLEVIREKKEKEEEK